MTTNEQLTAESVGAHFIYDAETGVLRWREKPGKSMLAGTPAGSKNGNGYTVVRFHGRDYYAHRIVWLMARGAWPVGQIDHINGDPADNRLMNLRDVSRQTNQQNKRRAMKRNKSGVLGVTTVGDKFIAQLTVNKKNIHLGVFATVDAAHSAYVDAKRLHHEGCTL